jgi:hypothetical protein
MDIFVVTGVRFLEDRLQNASLFLAVFNILLVGQRHFSDCI